VSTYVQLFWYHRWESAIPSTIGLILGMLYQSKFMPLHDFRLPGFIEAIFKVPYRSESSSS
jgi:hypothetical protein